MYVEPEDKLPPILAELDVEEFRITLLCTVVATVCYKVFVVTRNHVMNDRVTT